MTSPRVGEGLREPLDELGVNAAVFITAELWGVGNTGPWMFNGRAFTLDQAIRMHGGEAQTSRDEEPRLSSDSIHKYNNSKASPYLILHQDLLLKEQKHT